MYIETELDRIRTCDPRLKRAVLYLLSYQPDERGELYAKSSPFVKAADVGGLEAERHFGGDAGFAGRA